MSLIFTNKNNHNGVPQWLYLFGFIVMSSLFFSLLFGFISILVLDRLSVDFIIVFDLILLGLSLIFILKKEGYNEIDDRYVRSYYRYSGKLATEIKIDSIYKMGFNFGRGPAHLIFYYRDDKQRENMIYVTMLGVQESTIRYIIQFMYDKGVKDFDFKSDIQRYLPEEYIEVLQNSAKQRRNRNV